MAPPGGGWFSYGAVKAALRRDFAHEDAEEAGKKSKYQGLRFYAHKQSPKWSAVIYPPKGVKGRVEPHLAGSRLRSPLMIIHLLGCEAEAALASDLMVLWQRLHKQGFTAAKLKSARWNLPQLKLWDEKNVVKSLGGIEDPAKAQTRIRVLLRKWLPRLPRGILPKQQQQELDNQLAASERWEEQMRKERGKEDAAAAKERLRAERAEALLVWRAERAAEQRQEQKRRQEEAAAAAKAERARAKKMAQQAEQEREAEGRRRAKAQDDARAQRAAQRQKARRG